LGVQVHLAAARFWASGASTTVTSVHNGAALPAARVVVIAVPLVLLSGLWWVIKHRGR
jgi:predicted dinucleotide-binding enzyme